MHSECGLASWFALARLTVAFKLLQELLSGREGGGTAHFPGSRMLQGSGDGGQEADTAAICVAIGFAVKREVLSYEDFRGSATTSCASMASALPSELIARIRAASIAAADAEAAEAGGYQKSGLPPCELRPAAV